MEVDSRNESGKENQENAEDRGGAVHAYLGPRIEAEFHPKSLFTGYDANPSYLRCV
jgi:hypothetical protein